ncbi:MAG: hypothetical protein VX335_04600 [Pseudomonadota bacterium]|nr:hypothetical protein [Pseudomonadota bacterium]
MRDKESNLIAINQVKLLLNLKTMKFILDENGVADTLGFCEQKIETNQYELNLLNELREGNFSKDDIQSIKQNLGTIKDLDKKSSLSVNEQSQRDQAWRVVLQASSMEIMAVDGKISESDIKNEWTKILKGEISRIVIGDPGSNEVLKKINKEFGDLKISAESSPASEIYEIYQKLNVYRDNFITISQNSEKDNLKSEELSINPMSKKDEYDHLIKIRDILSSDDYSDKEKAEKFNSYIENLMQKQGVSLIDNNGKNPQKFNKRNLSLKDQLKFNNFDDLSTVINEYPANVDNIHTVEDRVSNKLAECICTLSKIDMDTKNFEQLKNNYLQAKLTPAENQLKYGFTLEQESLNKLTTIKNTFAKVDYNDKTLCLLEAYKEELVELQESLNLPMIHQSNYPKILNSLADTSDGDSNPTLDGIKKTIGKNINEIEHEISKLKSQKTNIFKSTLGKVAIAGLAIGTVALVIGAIALATALLPQIATAVAAGLLIGGTVLAVGGFLTGTKELLKSSKIANTSDMGDEYEMRVSSMHNSRNEPTRSSQFKQLGKGDLTGDVNIGPSNDDKEPDTKITMRQK